VEAAMVLFDGTYTRRHARNFIYTSYEKSGINYNLESFETSSLEDELGKIPDISTTGLFRYIDECINLFNTLEYAIMFEMVLTKNKSLNSIVVLTNQIKYQATSIRILAQRGLDNQSRALIRGLYEYCITWSRAIVDQEFREKFTKPSSAEEANIFWHKYISKSKIEKYLKDYNRQEPSKACLLVESSNIKKLHEIVGLSAHPLYLIPSIQYQQSWNDQNNLDSFLPSPTNISAGILASTCDLMLTTLNFSNNLAAELRGDTQRSKTTQIHILTEFDNLKDGVKCISRIANLMFLFLAKWHNRNRPDFDPEIHY
jgi:hypothetical protein